MRFKKTPSILFATHVGSQGGAEAKMRLLCKGIENASVITFDKGPLVESLKQDETPVHVCQMPGEMGKVRKKDGIIRLLSSLPFLIKMISKVVQRSKQYDIFVIMSQKAFIVFSIVKLITRKPLIWYMNDLLTQSNFSSVLVRVVIFLGRHSADHIIFNSQASLESWQAFGGSLDNTSVSYSGIDIEDYRNVDREKSTRLRSSLFKLEGPIVALVGRISPWKGQHIFLEAIAQMPGINGLIVGAPLFGEEDYLEQLESYIKRLNFEDRVVFTGHRDDIPDLIAACDLVVHCSTSPEPFGRVIVEAMLAGTPVVAAEAGGPTEIIEHKVSGFLTEPGNVDQLRQGIQWMLDHPDQAQIFANNARVYAEENFSSVVMIKHLKGLISKFT